MGAELTSLILQARSMKGRALTEDQVDTIVAQAQANLEELRSIVWSLQSEVPSWPVLVARLKRKCEGLCPEDVVFELVDHGAPGDVSLPLDWPTHLLRIAQEAVRNALRHGKPSRITLTMGVEMGGLRLEVVDDGRGFCPGDLQSMRGLTNMRNRAESLGGILHIDNASGGARIRLELSCIRPADLVLEKS